jgi:hypothetical protein
MSLVRCLARVLVLPALCWACNAYAAEAHVHGQARLDAAVDADTLTLFLDGPLDSFVGFERGARNARERDAVRRAAQALRAESVFVPSAAAKCKLKQVKLSSPVLDPALLASDAASAAAPQAGQKPKTSEEGHADIEGEYVYRCANVEALRAIEVRLFDAFKHLERLDVQVIAPQGQTGAKLTAKQRTVAW